MTLKGIFFFAERLVSKGTKMITYIAVSSLISGSLVGGIVYLISKKIFYSNAQIIIEQAKAKAKAIEFEASSLLQNQSIKLKEQEIELKQQYEENTALITQEYQEKLCAIKEKEHQLIQKHQQEKLWIESEKEKIKDLKNKMLHQEDEKEKLIKEYKKHSQELIETLSSYTQLTKKEAEDILLKKIDEQLCLQKARMIKRYEHEALEQAKKKANYIIAQATSKYAGEFASERLINVVHLPNDEVKGKIIGKEGRNIKTFEMITGVDVIIDDTPGIIVLSNFNLYRRAIALKTLEKLIEDGRIQPATIEETYHKVVQEMENQVFEDGQKIVLELGLPDIHPELQRLIGKLKYRASFGQNALGHSLEVAKLARFMALELGGNGQLACRAGLLHDIGKVLSQEGGNHVTLGADLCRRYNEPPAVINAIMSHHGDEEAVSIEACVVCAADAISAGRPGARREVLENFLNRMQDIEKIASEKLGVKQAYAISAGREVRVIVRADIIDDEGAIVLAKEIASEIEQNLHYPSEIKVNVIRETRAVEFAK